MGCCRRGRPQNLVNLVKQTLDQAGLPEGCWYLQGQVWRHHGMILCSGLHEVTTSFAGNFKLYWEVLKLPRKAEIRHLDLLDSTGKYWGAETLWRPQGQVKSKAFQDGLYAGPRIQLIDTWSWLALDWPVHLPWCDCSLSKITCVQSCASRAAHWTDGDEPLSCKTCSAPPKSWISSNRSLDSLEPRALLPVALANVSKMAPEEENCKLFS